MHWADLEHRQPRLAVRVRARLIDPSPEARDLQRDPRLLVHGLDTSADGAEGEVKMQGTALAATDVDLQHACAAGSGDRLRWPLEVGHFHLAELDIHTVSSVRYRDGGDPLVATWPPAVEFVPRASAPTQAGERVPVVDLLDPEGPDAPDGPDDPDGPDHPQ